jgi:CDP-diacylglycerol--glycerol-3-phosphate 3-phosphatidyltransferase/cardiolipin synthase
MVAIGWVMLKWVPFSPMYPCLVAAFWTLWSGVDYVREGVRILHENDPVPP